MDAAIGTVDWGKGKRGKRGGKEKRSVSRGQGTAKTKKKEEKGGEIDFSTSRNDFLKGELWLWLRQGILRRCATANRKKDRAGKREMVGEMRKGRESDPKGP